MEIETVPGTFCHCIRVAALPNCNIMSNYMCGQMESVSSLITKTFVAVKICPSSFSLKEQHSIRCSEFFFVLGCYITQQLVFGLNLT
jgi:hypothetical protein